MTTEPTFRTPDPTDDDALLELFGRVFESNGFRGTPRDRGFWQWRYRDHPGGAHSAIADDAGRPIAHVGGVPHRTWVRGDLRSSNQSMDNMVENGRRRGLRRVGLFAKTMNHWIDTWCGADRDVFAWGFPTEENVRIGQRFCKYSLLRTVTVLVDEDLAPGRRPFAGVEARPLDRPGAEVDALWARVAPELAVAVVRDAAHLAWRYVDHPGQAYALLGARDATTDELRGVAVVRAGGLDPTAACLVDWLVPGDDADATRALLDAAAGWARARGLGSVIAFFGESCPWFGRFQREGYLVQGSDLFQVARTWDRELSIPTLRRELYLTLGDVDYL